MRSLVLVGLFLTGLVLAMVYLKPGCPDCHCTDPAHPMCCCGGVCKPECACPACNCQPKTHGHTKGCN